MSERDWLSIGMIALGFAFIGTMGALLFNDQKTNRDMAVSCMSSGAQWIDKAKVCIR